jgi:hypothetical protein
MPSPRLLADFNGLFGDLLCLSHGETCQDTTGQSVTLKTGMKVTATEEDSNDHGEPDDLIASGIVEPSPGWLQCRGSKWVLRIDSNGVRHESDTKDDV